MGTGTFLLEIKERLMEGLKSKIKDPEDREKHILENMMWGVDLDLSKTLIAEKLINNKGLENNLLNENSLTLNWNEMPKFDVVIGNPPYQDDKKINIGGGSNKKLWRDFLSISINSLLKDDGYLAYIIPFSWRLGRKNPLNNVNIFRDYIQKYDTQYIEGDIEKYFDVGINISYVILQKTPYKEKTIINNNIINLKKWNFLPKDISDKSLSIWEKINEYPKFNFEMVRKSFDKKKTSEEKTTQSPFKIYKGKDRFLYTNMKSPLYNKRKAIINRMGNFDVLVDNKGDVNPDYSHVYLLSEKEDGNNLKDALENKKLYKFLLNNLKSSQYNEVYNTNKLPKIPLNKKWTDKELYDYFNLSKEEIDYIESQVK